jgi:hypothetical protein
MAIITDGNMKRVDLAEDTDELDFVLGRLPVKYRPVEPNEDLSGFIVRHLKARKIKEGEDTSTLPQKFLYSLGPLGLHLVTHVPSVYDGLKPGDEVAMIMGGSGDRLAFALSRQAEKIGAKIYRIPVARLKKYRESITCDIDEDAVTLADMLVLRPEEFYLMRPADRKLILVVERFRAHRDAMKERIKCQLRIYQRMSGKIFCSEDGMYPEGTIEDEFDKAKASDEILIALVKEEGRRKRELTAALNDLDVFQKVFKPIEGMGTLAGPIIATIQDIRRFQSDPKLQAFCGVHVKDGRFVRQRAGVQSNWKKEARQALYLFADQCNRRPDSVWGQRFLQYKANLRAKHPEVVVVDDKKRYTDGHIHKMAAWRTLSRLVRHIYKAWWKIERERAAA